MNKKRLKEICEKVLEIRKEAKAYVAIFADGPDFCSEKEMDYFIFKDGNGNEELMQLTYDDYKMCDRAGIVLDNSYEGFKHRYIYEFLIKAVKQTLEELEESCEVTKKCPKCGCTEFFVYPHVVQKWRVDTNGQFIKCEMDNVEMIVNIGDEDTWVCADCGYEADGWFFER